MSFDIFMAKTGSGDQSKLKHNPITSKQYWKDYLKHSALNAGQAARDVRYIHDHPHAVDASVGGVARHVIESIKKRVPSLANNLKYTAIPPQWHHTPDELLELRKATARKWFLHGYAPWHHKISMMLRTENK